MPTPTPNELDSVIQGSSADNHLVDVSTLATKPGHQGAFYHGTFIYGGGGNDIIYGETGSDANKDRGRDYFDGGAGTDMVTYAQSNAGMVVDLAYWPDAGRAYAIGHPTDTNNPLNRVDFLASIEDIFGSNHADIIKGSSVDNELTGFDGNDDIDGRGGEDTLYGGNGNDTVRGSDGHDSVRGDAGNDMLFGGTGVDTINGGDDDDSLYGGDHNDFLYGQDGYNKLYGQDGNDSMFIGESGEGYGEAGNDTILGDSLTDKLDGGSGNDFLNGQGGDDVLTSGTGNDTIDGGAGRDTGVFTDVDGATVAFTGNASGFVLGANSNDTFSGLEIFRLGGGGDSFLGSNAANIAFMNGGNDFAYGGDGDDLFYGEGGNDKLYGQDGNDTLFGHEGDDSLYGGEGNDVLIGFEGHDYLSGGAGNDTLDGGAGRDTLEGGEGNDVFHSNGTGDRVIGGAGNDVINLSAGAQEVRWYGGHTGFDTIHAFDLTQDELVFSRDFFAGTGAIDIEEHLIVMQSGNNALLYANTADAGWTQIAGFTNVYAAGLEQGIENGTLITLIGTVESA